MPLMITVVKKKVDWSNWLFFQNRKVGGSVSYECGKHLSFSNCNCYSSHTPARKAQKIQSETICNIYAEMHLAFFSCENVTLF